MKTDGTELHRDPLALVVAVIAVMGGVALRFYTVSDLWLDEALSVNIARLPVGEMFEALRHDGHPPLYYLLLHVWMQVFGEGDQAVRALSGAFGVAALPLAWIVGRRHGGMTVAVAMLALLSSSPFAARYATETRMYALITLEVLIGWLVLNRALQRPKPVRLAGVSASAGLLLLTHYWAFYLLAALMVTLAWGAWRGRLRGDRRCAYAVMAAIAGGGLLFVPWLSSFLEQAANTGTPWGAAVRPATMLMTTLNDFGGGVYGEAQLLGSLLGLLALVALVGRAVDSNRIEIDLRTLPMARPEWAVMAMTMTVALVAGFISSSAFASRYAAIVLALLLLCAARGIALLPRLAVQRVVLSGLVVVGLIAGVKTARTDRTQAGAVVATITQQAKPGDVVGFCPDQLGPSSARLLPKHLKAFSYPNASPPQLVDWVDYAKRMGESDPPAFGRRLDELAGPHAIWLVWSGDYRTVEGKCEALVAQLQQLRPTARQVASPSELFEHAQLWVFEAEV